MLTGCCQGQTEHPLSIPAAPERVLFVYRQLDFQWEVRFFAIPAPANRSFGRATIHMIEYLWVLRGFYHGWRCPSRVFIIPDGKMLDENPSKEKNILQLHQIKKLLNIF